MISDGVNNKHGLVRLEDPHGLSVVYYGRRMFIYIIPGPCMFMVDSLYKHGNLLRCCFNVFDAAPDKDFVTATL